MYIYMNNSANLVRKAQLCLALNGTGKVEKFLDCYVLKSQHGSTFGTIEGILKFVLLKSLSIYVIRLEEAQDFKTRDLEEEEEPSPSHSMTLTNPPKSPILLGLWHFSYIYGNY